jgi:uncharacterized protein (UPF0248 family)
VILRNPSPAATSNEELTRTEDEAVVPIHALLARVRWDPQYGRGQWEIGYLDRTRPGLVRIPLEDVMMRADIGFAFEVVDEEGVSRSIPYHRVRMVWRDGKLVWSRLARAMPHKIEKPRPPKRRPAAQPRMRR